MDRELTLGRLLYGAILALALASAAHAADGDQVKKDLVLKGDAKCTRCHDAEDDYPVLDIAKTRHGGSAGVSGLTCTSCHGDSRAHLDNPGGKADRPKPDRVFGKKGAGTPADQRSQACLACHAADRHLAFWDSGRHKKNDVACDSCHVIHEAKNTPLRKDNPTISPFVTTTRQLQYETCAACHKQIRSQLLKPSHHPIVEGKLACTSCHNPHGALSPFMVKGESVNQLCTGCHADKRGPFMWQHSPVEENCLTCHNSHGSIHTKLLNQRVPNLCQECHNAGDHAGVPYGGNRGFGGTAADAPNLRFIGRACLNCHTNIHGSNAPASRGSHFLR